jgi:hypothetical protein
MEGYLAREKRLLEEEIREAAVDFSTRYFAVYHLQRLVHNHPHIIDAETVHTLSHVVQDSRFSRERRGFFLLREAAEALTAVIVHSGNAALTGLAFTALSEALRTTTGHAHRVAAESLGSLPCSICGPELKDGAPTHVPRIAFCTVAAENNLVSRQTRRVGRSLVAPVAGGGKLFVMKLARANDSPESLCREVLWMEHLRSGEYAFPLRFDIPLPVRVAGAHLFSLSDIPAQFPRNMELHPNGYAVAFVADGEYFTYPNDCRERRSLTEGECKEVLFRNAWLLGRLTSLGIVHCAPIPLFHNRIQRCRRDDHGHYTWFRAGRLDRWLDSCTYPNFGVTGIRDFEHFTSFRGESRALYRQIGNHFLSLLLVTGSYFRNKDRRKVGFDAAGNPVDARALFDKQLLVELILGIFLEYYCGFVGGRFRGALPVDLDRLASRMTEEMGVDRHMEEVLRVADQKEMTREEFRSFLESRGYSRDNVDGLEQGERDIVVHTGPHLGGFNEGVSLPELIEAVATMAALCIVGSFWRQSF